MTAEQPDIEVLTDPVQYRCRRCRRCFTDLTVAAGHVSTHGELEGALAEALTEWQWQAVRGFSEALVTRLRDAWAKESADQSLMNPDEKELLAAYRKGVQDCADILKELLMERRP